MKNLLSTLGGSKKNLLPAEMWEVGEKAVRSSSKYIGAAREIEP
tara:strand:- start:458 stop:589 length:132 start_codon:yes stop_codon:yes gene_type:complete